jgi:N-acetylglucosamine-6-phosphate deacetylase
VNEEDIMKKIIIKNARVLIDGSFQNKEVVVENGKINSLEGKCTDDSYDIFDAEGMRLIPGFIDIHTHGAVGIDINHASAKDLERIGRFFATKGTTSWLGSIITDTKEKTISCIQEYLQYKKSPHTGAEMFGIHLEGPFLSYEYRGAHPDHLLCMADIELIREYQSLAQGDIKYITISPEAGITPQFIKELRDLGIVVSIGHSGADYDTTMECISAGAMTSTHTFNAMKLLHQHFPAMSGAVLESDIYCEAICDGRHLHPGIVRLILKTKGLDKVLLVTDSITAAGLEDGFYKLGVNDIVVKDGDAKLVADGVRAGSTLTMDLALRNILEFTGRNIEEVLTMLGQNQAELLGIYDNVGSITVGKNADFIIIDNENFVQHTFINGEKYID